MAESGKQHNTVKSTNVHWHSGEVTRGQRANLLGHKGGTVWLFFIIS